MARLYLKENDFSGYAEARIREAKALAGKPRAGRGVARRGTRVPRADGAPDKAQILLRGSAEEDPRNADALRSLSALLVVAGRVEEAKTVLAAPAGDLETPETRAAVLTDSRSRRMGGSADAAAAQRYLDER